MIYKEIHITVSDEELRFRLMALLENAGFESFMEEEKELIGYIRMEGYDHRKVKGLLTSVDPSITFIEYTREDKNWNEEWEKNYPPVLITDRCYIRAPFHPERRDIPLEIIIEPRMAFGTAHHETTALMIEWELETDFSGKKVLDMGCGTGILAILANKLGALNVMAIDNDEWAYQNALDNIMLNNTGNISVYLGDASLLEGSSFDIILANINRNILLHDLGSYARSLSPGGIIILSGFLEEDVSSLAEQARRLELEQAGMKVRLPWVAVCFRKTGNENHH